MSMTYLFFGNDEERISIYLNSFIDKFFESDDSKKNVITYNAQETPITEVLDECNQLSLAYDKKIVVLKNASFLKKESKFSKVRKSKVIKNNNYELLEKYILDDNNDDVILVILFNDELIDNDNIIFKAIPATNRKLLLGLKDEEWNVYVNKFFNKKGYDISFDAINEIVYRSNGSLKTFLNESEKLILYCDKKISLEDVKKIFVKPEEDDVFALTKSLLSGNKDETLSKFRSLRLTQNIEPITLINLMSSSLMLIDSILYLKNKGLSIDEIASELKVKRGKIYYTLKDAQKLKKEDVTKALKQLYFLDKSIKHNEVDRFYAFEIFLLNFNN